MTFQLSIMAMANVHHEKNFMVPYSLSLAYTAAFSSV